LALIIRWTTDWITGIMSFVIDKFRLLGMYNVDNKTEGIPVTSSRTRGSVSVVARERHSGGYTYLGAERCQLHSI